MKKIMSVFLIAFITLALSACIKTSDSNEPINETSDIKTETVEKETRDTEIKNQEKTTQVNNAENQVKKARQCLSCKRVIGASKYNYCDGCRCRHLQGCPMIRKSGSSYCVSHVCEKSGCSLERTSTSDYCDLHRNN